MSDNLDLTQLVPGQENPEVTANDQAGEIDAALTEELTLDTSSANVTVSDANYRRAIQLKITGDGDVGRTVTLPAIKRLIAIHNADSASRDIIRGSTTITLAAGASAILYTDGTTDGLRQITNSTAGSGFASLSTEDQALTGGVIVTSKALGTITTGTVTPDPGDRPMQHYTNDGAHTLAPSSNNGSLLLDITNGASAGAITTSGFTFVAGDSFTTTNGHKFRCHISIGNAGSLLTVQAMQ